MRPKKAKRLVLDDGHLDPKSKVCQNRRCTALATMIVNIDSNKGSFDVPMCLNCARLAIRPQPKKRIPIRNAETQGREDPPRRPAT